MSIYGAALRELEQYRRDEAAGLLLRLPVPLGATVWRVRDNPACHHGVREAEKFLFGRVVTPRRIVEPTPFTLALLDAWGKTVFSTEAEGSWGVTAWKSWSRGKAEKFFRKPLDPDAAS